MNDFDHLTLPHKLQHWARERPQGIALRQKDFGIWSPITWQHYETQARHFGIGLMALGMDEQARVAIISENRCEWVYSQIGCGMAALVTVGIYPTSPAAEVAYLLKAADVAAVVCEDQEQLDKVVEALEGLEQAPLLIVIDPKGLRHYTGLSWHSFAAVCEMGRQAAAALHDQQRARLARQTPQDVALMIFTSGSTGRPKAAMITYSNITAMAMGAQNFYHCDGRDAMLSYLPLCHVAEQIFTISLPMQSGALVNFAESLRTVQTDLREIAPTVFLGVPRIWEKMHASIVLKMREARPIQRWLFDRAFVAVNGFASKPRSGWTLAQKMHYALWYFLVFRALCNFLGLRKCRRAMSGAAPVSPDLLRFFRIMGVQITEGYGMTETAGIATLQRDSASPLGTVGEPLAGLEVRIAEDGELLLRGPTVFKGYFRNPQASAEAIDAQGWLHTGDMAQWVATPDLPQGREIKIVDRKKDIMITAGGKNISPSEIENMLKFSGFIKEAIIVADKRHFVSALIQIDPETVGKWAEEKSITYTNFKSLAEHPEVRDLVAGEVDGVNRRMPQVQHVRKFHLLTKELDHDDGEVTATMKIRRQNIARVYAEEIEALYRN
ncbi:MAG: long-chain fatty acid--CoA ligase [Betaproteobacteria bacterium]|nr:long-chain fatty acid--CoA ligase [Betaproteobacteria bacterium]